MVLSTVKRMRLRRAPLTVFLVALAVRLVWVVTASRDGFPFRDSLYYHLGAESILAGHGYAGLFGVPIVRWAPGYSGLLAGVYWLFGTSPLRGEIMNAVVGALTVPLLYVTFRRAFNERVALIAAVMLCFMPGPILWTDLLVTETVFTFLFVAFVALVVLSSADMVSVFIRGSLVPLVTPDEKRGRVLSVENVFIGASNELGAFESGMIGQAVGVPAAVVGGGIATIAIVGLWGKAFPSLRNVDRFEDLTTDG